MRIASLSALRYGVGMIIRAKTLFLTLFYGRMATLLSAVTAILFVVFWSS